jgi:tRNA dimethylallyltransferase
MGERLDKQINGRAIEGVAGLIGQSSEIGRGGGGEKEIGGASFFQPLGSLRIVQRTGKSGDEVSGQARALWAGDDGENMAWSVGRVMGHSQALGVADMDDRIAAVLGRGEGLSALLIAGPTASGKSALALKLAKKYNGVVVNADSMQVYADLRVLTARPSFAEEAELDHFLYGHVDGAVNYSVGRWLEDIAALLPLLRAKGQVPIITGGTGLYFKALLEGLSPIPAVPDEVRGAVRAEAERLSAAQLHDLLGAQDPLMAARLKPADRQRILRALEVVRATGRSLLEFQNMPAQAAVLEREKVAAFFLAPERGSLYARIDQRFEAMMQAGALEEVRLLAARQLDPLVPVMRAHGVPGLMAYLRGENGLAAAVERGQSDTRHYVKRQFTFARHQLNDFKWVLLG